VSAVGAATPTDLSTPSLRRRLACFVYEGVLLFGVVVGTELIFAPLVQQRHALYLREWGMALLFAVLGLYFVWFWTHGGQTLAMKTWRIRVVTERGGPLTMPRALARYLAAWLWFLPPLAMVSLQLRSLGGAAAFAVVLIYTLAYAAFPKLHRSQQFPHDILCGTRLVNVAR
jgi:uncharacterized RDD family membrane protein YckC